LYYGDIFGQIVALEIATYETEAPSSVPSATPSEIPSASPTLTMKPTDQASTSPSRAPTNSPTGTPVFFFPNPSVTLPPDANPDNSKSIVGAEDDLSDDLGLIIGAAAGGIFFLVSALFLICRRRRERQKEEMIRQVKVEKGDLEVATGDSAVEVEVVGGANVYSPKRRKPENKKGAKVQSPGTPNTLESIGEHSEDFTPVKETAVVLLGHQISSTVQNLDAEKFSYVVEVQTEEEQTPENSDDEGKRLDLGEPVSAAGDVRHREMEPAASPSVSVEPVSAAGDVHRREMEPAASPSVSVEPVSAAGDVHRREMEPAASPSVSVEPVSAAGEVRRREMEPAASHLSTSDSVPSSDDCSSSFYDEHGEEKKESRDSNKSPTSAGSDRPSSPASPLLLSVMSTDSSVYAEVSNSFDAKDTPRSVQSLSPLSPHIISKSIDEPEDAPDDEKMTTSARSFVMQPSLSQEGPDNDELMAPGTHYMAKSSTRSPADVSPAESSMYGRSVRPTGTDNIRSVRSKGKPVGHDWSSDSDSASSDVRKRSKPTFTRGSKREEKEKTEEKGGDTWDSFLKELEDAEEQFFSPSNSARLDGDFS
jgi:hypothetical protein